MIITAQIAMKRASWRFRSLQSFFGLNNDYMKSVHDKMNQMQYYGKWDYLLLYNLPTGLREYFYMELIRIKEEENKAKEEAAKASR